MPQDHMPTIRSLLSELAETHVKAALFLDKIQELVATEVAPEVRKGQLPLVDQTTFCVTWHERKCHLGNTRSFLLFSKLCHRCNHYVHYDQLLRDVWHGDVRSYDTVRSAVRELKCKLCHARMQKLAQVIEGQGQHYGLMLERL